MNIYDSSEDYGDKSVILIYDGKFDENEVKNYMMKNYNTDTFEIVDFKDSSLHKGLENPGTATIQIENKIMEKRFRKIVNEEMRKLLEQDAEEEMERAKYQAYQDIYLVPQSNWRLKQVAPMLNKEGKVYKGKIGEIHKIQTVEYDFLHTGEIVTECGGETYTMDADDFRKSFEMLPDEEGLKVNNESVIKEVEMYNKIVEHRPIPVTVEKSWTGNHFIIKVPPMKMRYETAQKLGDNVSQKQLNYIKSKNLEMHADPKLIQYPNDVTISSYDYKDGKVDFSAGSLRDVQNWLKAHQGIVKEEKSVNLEHEIKKLSKIKDYFGKNIRESVERLEKLFLTEVADIELNKGNIIKFTNNMANLHVSKGDKIEIISDVFNDDMGVPSYKIKNLRNGKIYIVDKILLQTAFNKKYAHMLDIDF